MTEQEHKEYEQRIIHAMENDFDGMDKFLLVEEIIERQDALDQSRARIAELEKEFAAAKERIRRRDCREIYGCKKSDCAGCRNKRKEQE